MHIDEPRQRVNRLTGLSFVHTYSWRIFASLQGKNLNLPLTSSMNAFLGLGWKVGQ